MLWKRGRQSLIYKYIISYLFVFLIPFSLMSLFIYYNSVASLRDEIEQSNVNKLEQVENMTTERIEELKKTATRIAYDPRLTPYMMKHGYYGGEAQEELKKYKDNSSIIQELFVYFHDQEQMIYSSSGLHTVATVKNRLYEFDSWSTDSMLQKLHTNQPLIYPAGNVTIRSGVQARIIAFIFPIAPNNPNPYGAVMYFVEESVLANMIENILGDFKGNTYILDENAQPVVAAVKDKEVTFQQLNPDAYEKSGVRTVKMNGKKYSITTVTSEASGWTFLTLLDDDQFLERVVHRETFVFILMLVLLLIGLSLAIVLGRKQYRPIRGLFEAANLAGENRMSWTGANELDVIHETITKVFKDHKSLAETVDLQKPYAKDQLLAKMLKESFPDEKEIEHMQQALNMEMKQGPHFVAIVEFQADQYEKEPIEQREHLLCTLSQIHLPNVTVNAVDLLYQNAVAFIISLDDEQDAVQKRRRLSVQLQTYIKEKSPIKALIVAVGTNYSEKTHINRSYIEALATLDYKFTSPQESLIFFEELGSPNEKALGYPKEDQIKLAQSMKQGDQVVALETLNTMLNQLVKADISIQPLKYICFDIINTIIKTAIELQLVDNLDEVKEIGEFHSVEELKQRLSPLVLRICQQVEDKTESRSKVLRKDILLYIDSHYKEYDLSLEAMAENFRLSVPYLSKFIKEQTGETFTQYVLSLRMEEAKKQLKETNQPIKSIVTNIGYKDVANFTRRFKQLEGVTPGQYRKLNR